jgi:hypothetical protein
MGWALACAVVVTAPVVEVLEGGAAAGLLVLLALLPHPASTQAAINDIRLQRRRRFIGCRG